MTDEPAGEGPGHGIAADVLERRREPPHAGQVPRGPHAGQGPHPHQAPAAPNRYDAHDGFLVDLSSGQASPIPAPTPSFVSSART